MKLMKKSLAAILALAMCLSLLPANVFAADLMEAPICGFEEHIHDDGCYTAPTPVHYCRAAAQHDCIVDDVYDEETGELLFCALVGHDCDVEGCYVYCGKEEHLHDELCLVDCPFEEHMHDWACFQAEPVLNCTIPEHTHNPDCYPAPAFVMDEVVDDEPVIDEFVFDDAEPKANAPVVEEPEEAPADVQAFLDAVAMLPAEITADNVKEAGMILMMVGEAYDALEIANMGRADVQAAVLTMTDAMAVAQKLAELGTSTLAEYGIKNEDWWNKNQNNAADLSAWIASNGDSEIILAIYGDVVFHGTVTIPYGKTVKVYSYDNSRAIYRDGSLPLFTVQNGGRLLMGGDYHHLTLKGESGDGSLLVVESGGELTLNKNVTVRDSHTSNNGGGVYVHGGGKLTINNDNVHFENCTATQGGANVYAEDISDVTNHTSITVDGGSTSSHDEFNNKRVFLAIYRDAHKSELPAEPGEHTEDKYFFMKSTTGSGNDGFQYESGYAFIWNPASVINEDILRDEDYTRSTVWNDNTWGLVDPTGNKLERYLSGLNLETILTNFAAWNETDHGWMLQVGEGEHGVKLSSSNVSNYKLVPYVIKYQANGNDNDGWHIDCAVVSRDSIQVGYNLNLPTGVSTGSQQVTVPATQTGLEQVTLTMGQTNPITVSGAEYTVNGNTYYVTLTFAGWNTKTDGTGVAYEAGKEYTFTESTTLYAQWKVNNPSYTVKFFYDGVEDETLTETRNPTLAEFKAGQVSIKESDKTPKSEDYELEKVEPGETVTLDMNGNTVIGVYFKSKTPETEEINYTIQYYMAGSETPFDTKSGNGTVPYGQKLTVTSVPAPDAQPDNTELDHYAPDLPATVNNGDVIKVYYKLSTDIWTVKWVNGEAELESREFDNNQGVPAAAEYTGETPAKAADENYTYAFSGWSEADKDEANKTITYTAQFEATEIPTWTVKWVNGEAELDSKTFKEGQAEPKYDGATPTKAADENYTYAFSGWSEADKDEANKTITYTAQFEATEIPTWTVKWVNGEAELDSKTFKEGQAEPKYTGENPTKADSDGYSYTFDKWSDADKNEAEKTITYTAEFKGTAIEYTITYDLDGGKDPTTANPGTYKVTDTVNITNAPTKANHTFQGWALKDGENYGAHEKTVTFGPGVTGNRTYKAVWAEVGKSNLTIKMVTDDDEPAELGVESITDIYVGTEYSCTEDKDGFTFAAAGKSQAVDKALTTEDGNHYVYVSGANSGDTITADGNVVTLVYALDNKGGIPGQTGDGIPDKYQAEVTYKVKNGAWNDDSTDDQTVVVTFKENGEPSETGTATLAAPEVGNKPADGHKAGSWDTDPATVTLTKDGAKEYTYTYAKKDTYTVTFDSKGGSAVAEQTITEGGKATEPNAPTKDGFVFKGWNLGDAAYKFETVVTEDITLVAQWKEDTNNNGTPDEDEAKYTVTYIDGVDGNVFNEQKTEGILLGTATPEFTGDTTRKDYVFTGWSPKLADKVTETVTYVAQWKDDKNNNGTPDEDEDKYTVTYIDGVDGNVFNEQKTEGILPGTATPEFTGSTTRKGYLFAGWDKAIAETVTENVTYTAQWDKDVLVDPTVPKDQRPGNGGDGIPDKYQVTVYYEAGANGSVSFDSTVVTKLDKDGKPAEDGDAKLAKEHIPSAIPNYRYTVNKWSPKTPFAGLAVADKDTFKVTFSYVGGGSGGGSTPTPPTPPSRPTGGGSGGGNGGGTTPTTPTTTITDEDVPLASATGLNDTEHMAYIIGYGDGTVRPEGNITRAEVATIFFRLMTDIYRTINWSTENDFSDVSVGMWHNNAISTCANAEILKGYTDGTFLPGNNITRAEFAAIAARFLDGEYTGEGVELPADCEGHWAADYIRSVMQADWWFDVGEAFEPGKFITRAEVMVVINRMLHRVPEKEHLLPEMKKWSDNPEDAWYYEAVQEATNEHDYEWIDKDETIENWTELLKVRDWAALEAEWATANS